MGALSFISWRPGIGDPTPVGWLTVAAYFLAAWLCLAAARATRIDRQHPSQPATFWIAIAAALILLGINKQLDLQTLLTQIGREVARCQGWYDQRRTVQAAFIAAVTAACIAALATLALLARRSLQRLWLALVGIVFLVCFIAIRAASFHHVDRLLGLRLGGLKINWILELGGIGCVIICACANSFRLRRNTRERA